MLPTIRRAAVSNTGPLISTFQANKVSILRLVYDVIFISESELAEFKKHGAAKEIHELINTGFIVVLTLTDLEKQTAQKIAEAIAQSRLSKDKVAQNHYPEAEAIALMERKELQAQEILLDELAARSIATKRGIPVVGFAGVLIRVCRQGLLSAKDVRDILTLCQQQGTHYSNRFIAQVYRRLKEEVK